MFIYIIMILFLVILFMASITKYGRRNKKAITIVAIGFLIIIQVLRSFDVGVDLKSYKYYFDLISDMSIIQAFEYSSNEQLYYVMNWLASSVFGDFRSVLFITSLIMYIPLGYVTYKYSKNSILSIFIFVTIGLFAFTLSGLRQTIAIGFTLMSYTSIRSKKPLQFLILVLIASLFHQSAIIFLLAYPIYYFKLTKKYFMVVIFALVMIFIFREPIFEILITFYFKTYDPSATGAFGFYMGLWIIWLFFMYSFRGKFNTHINGLMNMILLALIIQTFASYHPFVMRLGYYFYLYLIILIPEYIYSIKRATDRDLVLASIILVFTIYFIIGIKDSILEIYPYEFLLKTNDITKGVLFR